MQQQGNGFDSGKANTDQGQSNLNQAQQQPSDSQKNAPTGEASMWNSLLDEDEETARRREEGGRGTDHENFCEELPTAMTNQFQNQFTGENKREQDEDDENLNSELHS